MDANHTPPTLASRPRTRGAVRLLFFCSLLVAHCALATGCRSNNRYDLLEAELRTRERELADARAALDQNRNLLRAYEQSQRPAPASGAPGPFLPVKEISFGRGTGGADEDGAPGDEGMVLVIVPKDEDGAAVKVPGRAVVAAWEVSPAGIKAPIGSWDVPAEKLRRTWKSGLISTGYFVALPWQTVPTSDRVRVAVRLVTSDGRAYETDRDVTVKPPGGALPRTNVLPPPQPAVPGFGVPKLPGGGGGAPPSSGREPLFPDPLPPGAEELPPPSRSGTERGAILLPPVKQ
jgi:hypothetical protein